MGSLLLFSVILYVTHSRGRATNLGERDQVETRDRSEVQLGAHMLDLDFTNTRSRIASTYIKKGVFDFEGKAQYISQQTGMTVPKHTSLSTTTLLLF